MKARFLAFVGLAFVFLVTAFTGNVKAIDPFIPRGNCVADSFFAAGLEADKACDGNAAATVWLSADTYPHWIYMVFPALYHVTSVYFDCAICGGSSPGDISVQAWDGASWNQIAYVNPATQPSNESISVTPTDTTRIRFYSTVSSGGVSTRDEAAEISARGTLSKVPPVITTIAASGIVCNSAVLNSNLTSKGTASIIAVGFQYGKNPTLAGATNHTVSTNATTGLFNFTVTGLNASTFYYFRAWANGTDGYATGSILFFETSACPPVTTCTPDQSGSNLLTLLILSIVAAIVFLFGIRFNAGMLLLSGILTLSVGFSAFSATCNLIIGIAIELLGLMVILWTIGGIIDARKEGQT